MMKTVYHILLLLIFPLYTNVSYAQNCSSLISQNKTLSGTQILSTDQFTVIVRGSYSYAMSFNSDERGVTINMYSKGGVTFNLDDEIIFMDANKTRKSYRFVELGFKEKQSTTPVHYNTLQLDLEAARWFANNNITIFYIKNNVSNQMRKMTVTGTRQTDIRSFATCFLRSLDEEGVKDVKLTGNDLSTRSKANNANKPISSTKSKVRAVADISQLNDEELAQLQKELMEEKQKIKELILSLIHI